MIYSFDCFFGYYYFVMQSQLPIHQTMPLFSPQYPPSIYERLFNLKQRMKDQIFDEQTNLIAQKILLQDSGNYNAWYCKKMFIITNNSSIEHQYQFTDACLGRGKSFQVWQQKRFLLDYHKNVERELTASQNIIQTLDMKNYHAWSYRVYLVNRLGNYQQQLVFADQMISKDLLNNSFWSYKFFLLQQICDKNPQKKAGILSKEVPFALQKIQVFKHNLASWNYLRGFFPSIRLKNFSSKNSLRPALIQNFDQFPTILQCCVKWWQQLKKDPTKSNSLYSMMITKSQIQILSTLVQIHSQKEQSKRFAFDICEQLAGIDKQRQFYWKWVQKNL